MKMMVLLLVSSAALLVSPSPILWDRTDLMSIMDHARNLTVSPTEFVLDLKREYDCWDDMFFCKVYFLLHKNKRFKSREVGQKLLRTLAMFNKKTNVNCAEVPKDPTPTPNKVWLTMPNLIKDLISCSQMRMVNKTQEPTVAQ